MKINTHITLCGMMGAGKSAHGRELASIMNMEFVDLDAAIRNITGKKIADIFKQYGESEFRRIELSTLEKLLSANPQVIALGGGALQTEEVVALVKNKSILCFIDAPFDVILSRVQKNNKRPLLLNEDGVLKPESEISSLISSLFEKRLPSYLEAQIHYQPKAGLSVKKSAHLLYEKILDHAR